MNGGTVVLHPVAIAPVAVLSANGNRYRFGATASLDGECEFDFLIDITDQCLCGTEAGIERATSDSQYIITDFDINPRMTDWGAAF